MDLAATIICTAIGSTGLFAFVQFLITRKDKKGDEIKALRGEISALNARLSEIEQSTLRNELLSLIQYDGDNVDAICRIGTEYKEKGGDKYMTAKLNKWADEHNVLAHWE